MKQTSERHHPDRARSLEERVIDAIHRYAYEIVGDFAHPSDRLLDVGFGEGYGSEIVRPYVREYSGVEVSLEAVDHARMKYARPGVSFYHYGGDVLPFRDASFDLLISFQVIEHVDDVSRFLREVRRVGRPGATVLVVTPNRNHRVEDGERPWNRYHRREFNPSELRSSLAEVFSEVEVFGIHGSEAMERVERARVARARRLARLDPFGLRYRLPESLDNWLRMLLRTRAGRSSTGDEAVDLATHQIRHSTDGVETSLDLLAVATN
jgi:SAM-dependent methyltransferase